MATDLLMQLEAQRRKGLKLIMVTGRALPDLRALIDITRFDALVVENGAIVVVGDLRTSLAPPGWRATREELLHSVKSRGHEEVIISLRRTMERSALQAITDAHLGDRVRVEFNKESMMLTPRNVDKGSGLAVALRVLRIDPQDVMALGDGENDLSMFHLVGLGVAVRNAVPELIREADSITKEENGRGVSEAIERFCGPMS